MREVCVDFEPCSKCYTVALSLFILKSSNWDKINDASYSNLSCGQIVDCLQFETHPCPLHNFRVAKSTLFLFLAIYYVHYTLPTCSLWLPIFFIYIKHQVSPKDLCLFCVTCIRPLIPDGIVNNKLRELLPTRYESRYNLFNSHKYSCLLYTSPSPRDA